VRVKSRWNKKDRVRSAQETASAMGFICCRIAQNALLNIENADFQVDTQLQRLEVIKEFLAFLTHVVDRIAYDRMDDEERAEFIRALARRLADYVQDNTRDFAGPGDYRTPFIDLLNRRMEDYAEFSFIDGGPSFQLARYFSERVGETLGPRNRQWIGNQIIDAEVPEAMESLRKAVKNLLPERTPRQEADA